jgi:hypothetical protein
MQGHGYRIGLVPEQNAMYTELDLCVQDQKHVVLIVNRRLT